MNLSGVNKETWIRSVITLLAAVNVFAGYLGYDLIKLSDADIAAAVDGMIIFVTALVWAWGWWKNNSVTLKAQLADEFMVKQELTK